MTGTISNDRLMRFLNATPEQQAAIERVLNGQMEAPCPATTGPLLLMMGDAAKLAGISRATLWRMIKLGKFKPVEILPGTFRVRRADIEAMASGKAGL
jgi:predicted DNA-binding transcriptional regulator AlpA